MKTTIQYIVGILMISLAMTACGGGGSDDPTPPAATTESILGSAWTLATVNSSNDSDEYTTFVLRSFTLSEGGNYTVTLYPNSSQSGT